MTTPTTTMRLDEAVKGEARPILENLGLNITSATNMFLRAVVRYGGIPFDLRLGAPAQTSQQDFAAEYIAPLMSSRNEVRTANSSISRIRARLAKRCRQINENRRIVSW